MIALSFRDALAKAEPGVAEVHIATAGGKKKPRTFGECVGKALAFEAGDRIKVRDGAAHPGMEEMAFGVVESVSNERPLAIKFDGSDEIHRWYVGSEIEPAGVGIEKAKQPRVLRPIDEERSHTPFPYDAGALGRLREDQVPRFFGALTDSEKLDISTLPLASLVAMQNRVDHNKVAAIREAGGAGGKLPVVIRAEDRNYIADGHHRLTALWLDGATEAQVRFKDLTPETNIMKGLKFEVPITKTNEDQNLVFGWASVIEENGRTVVDSHGDTISEHELERAFYGFAKDARVAGYMHEDVGEHVGHLIECMVFTKAKQQALGIDLGKIGAWVGFKVDPAIFKRVRDGEIRALSIGGSAMREVDE